MTLFDNPKNYWLRWLGLLPIAFLTAFLINLVYSLMMALSFHGTVFEKLLSYVIPYVGSAFGFVFSGSIVAPHHKRKSAFALLVIFLLLTCGVFIFNLSNDDLSQIAPNISMVVGSALAYSTVRKEHPWHDIHYKTYSSTDDEIIEESNLHFTKDGRVKEDKLEYVLDELESMKLPTDDIKGKKIEG